MKKAFEISFYVELEVDDYTLEDEETVPLQIICFLFDIMNYKNNIIIKNLFNEENDDVRAMLKKHVNNSQNLLYESHKKKYFNFALWIKETISSNLQIMDLLLTQVLDLSYIVPKDNFDINQFIKFRKKDEKCLIEENKASFICNITDSDRNLILYFNLEDYTGEEINEILKQWFIKLQEVYGKFVELTFSPGDFVIDFKSFNFTKYRGNQYRIRLVKKLKKDKSIINNFIRKYLICM